MEAQAEDLTCHYHHWITFEIIQHCGFDVYHHKEARVPMNCYILREVEEFFFSHIFPQFEAKGSKSGRGGECASEEKILDLLL